MDITSFIQSEEESLYEAWERYKELLIKYSHHGLLDWLIVQNFYDRLNYSTKINIDVAISGVLMEKSTKVTHSLIEEMATVDTKFWYTI